MTSQAREKVFIAGAPTRLLADKPHLLIGCGACCYATGAATPGRESAPDTVMSEL